MIRNYFKIAIRNLRRHAGFTAINIAGLTLGLTACLLIGLFVWDEKQYDKFIPEGDSIYRVYIERNNADGNANAANTPPMFATTMKRQYPEVEKTMRILMSQFKALFEVGNKKIYEENGLFAEPEFLELFPLKVKFGSREKALTDPNSIVLSEEMSERFFGNQ
ncbi:MAG TPA: ABC transporter permease, partial [Chitinophagaceae bacterium]|nr:ABC transporter permease [Chitinophagaceae bacterium]